MTDMATPKSFDISIEDTSLLETLFLDPNSVHLENILFISVIKQLDATE